MTTDNPFAELGLHADIVAAVAKLGFETPTPIQAQAIGPVLEGRDVAGCAQTGSGKTAAYALPSLHRLMDAEAPVIADDEPAQPCFLVLAPTRELCVQIKEDIITFTPNIEWGVAALFGGVSRQPQLDQLATKPRIVVATPGRLLDFVGSKDIKLDKVNTIVLDEADRMLDLGFIHDMKSILNKTPESRQTLLFSATLPKSVREFNGATLTDPVEIHIDTDGKLPEHLEQAVYFTKRTRKSKVLKNLLQDIGDAHTVVFVRTQRDAQFMARTLQRTGFAAEALHAHMSQTARHDILAAFKAGEISVLVATDVASRGLDVPTVSHVINMDIPKDPDVYIHRIGRTARAGQAGMAIAICDEYQGHYLHKIQHRMGVIIPAVIDHKHHSDDVMQGKGPTAEMRERGRRQRSASYQKRKAREAAEENQGRPRGGPRRKKRSR